MLENQNHLFAKLEAELFLNMGNTYFEAGKAEKAITCYLKALEMRYNYEEALLYLGAAYYSIGDLSSAIKHWKNAIEINGSEKAAYYIDSIAYYEGRA